MAKKCINLTVVKCCGNCAKNNMFFFAISCKEHPDVKIELNNLCDDWKRPKQKEYIDCGSGV